MERRKKIVGKQRSNYLSAPSLLLKLLTARFGHFLLCGEDTIADGEEYNRRGWVVVKGLE